MALTLSLGLWLTGVSENLDALLLELFLPDKMETPTVEMNAGIPWAATILIAFGLPAVLLHLRTNWQRMVIFITFLVLSVLWIPVILLAAIRPEVSSVLAAIAWSGCCAIFYAGSKAENPAATAQPGGEPLHDLEDSEFLTEKVENIGPR